MSSHYSHRGRTSRRGGFNQSSAQLGHRSVMEGLVPAPISTIAAGAGRPDNTEVKIKDLEYLGSYNWADRSSPTIIVPGSPPLWRNRRLPYQVQPDVGFAFKHQHGARYPKAPLLPLFVAVDQTARKGDHGIDWPSIDFITDRNNLRKLLRWTSEDTTSETPSNFRIDMQLAGTSTVLLSRWETQDKVRMYGISFGFNFEKESTQLTPGCEDETGHHRIVKYDLNGLKIVVRSKVDACYHDEKEVTAVGAKPSRKPGDNLDNLLAILSATTIATTPRAPSMIVKGIANSDITVIKAGAIVPQSSVAELTTRSVKNASFFNWKETYPQLFLSQTSHYFLAVHERGKFIQVQKRELDSAELRPVAAASQYGLKRLRHVLDAIKELVMKHGKKGRLSLICKDGQLKVYERFSDDSFLPDEFMARFNSPTRSGS